MPILSDLRALLDSRRQAKDPNWMAWDGLANSLGLPRQWIVCPSCGQQGWRFPPHQFDPCPLVLQMAEVTGLKFDAERATSVRMGVHMEELTRMMRQQMEDGDE